MIEKNVTEKGSMKREHKKGAKPVSCKDRKGL